MKVSNDSMNLLILSAGKKTAVTIALTPMRLVFSLFVTLAILASSFAGLAGWMSQDGVAKTSDITATPPSWVSQIAEQKAEISNIRTDNQANLDALAIRLGQLQGQMLRIDGLGQKLTDMAKLDDGEFDFSDEPGIGGPVDASQLQSVNGTDLLQSLTQLEARLQDQEQQLTALESLVWEADLEKKVAPAGAPVASAWISSYFGMRTDPFTGKRANHTGIDFASKPNSEIVAVAAGVVTWSGDAEGYGKMVEINHGNGLVTRYGHNARNLVKVGDTVAQGQVIAKMGSTGRSTGTHVHFEVLKNGKQINPKKYTQKSRQEG